MAGSDPDQGRDKEWRLDLDYSSSKTITLLEALWLKDGGDWKLGKGGFVMGIFCFMEGVEVILNVKLALNCRVLALPNHYFSPGLHAS